MLYEAIKALFSYAFHLFYSITIISHGPMTQGPAIVYANHPTYITDLMAAIITNPRCLRPIVAQISMKTSQMGCYLRGINSIEMVRPQDVEKKMGKGTVRIVKSGHLQGKNTHFEELKPKTTIFIKNRPDLKISKVISNQRAKIQQQNIQVTQQSLFFYRPVKDYSDLYQEVWKTLDKKQAILIFPQGQLQYGGAMGSFKAGISKMALGAIEKHGSQFRLVPCALHYHRQHLFRSKLVVEYGQAYSVPQTIVDLYLSDRRKATGMLLELIEEKMKSMVVNYENQQEKQILFLFRQLYILDCRREVCLDQKLRLNHLFFKIFKAVEHKQHNKIYQRIQSFSKFLITKGISVKGKHIYSNQFSYWLDQVSIIQGLPHFFMMIPGFVLWGLMIQFVNFLSQTQRKYWVKQFANGNSCKSLVANYKIFLSTFLISLNYLATCTLLWPMLSYYELSNLWLVSCFIMLVFQLLYAPFFVQCYDKFRQTWTHLKFLNLKLMDPKSYKHYLNERVTLKKLVRELVQIQGPKVCSDFKKQRAIEVEFLAEK